MSTLEYLFYGLVVVLALGIMELVTGVSITSLPILGGF
jgi:hypothetical protein